jgi:predicted adenylyl cyclase CyaB
VLQQYFETVWPAKKAYVDPTAAQADVIVESCYDPATEAYRAGPIQYQIKARGWAPDDHLAALCRATRLGTSVMQVDRFLKPRAREFRGEMLRLRIEGGEVLLTYKGPFLPDGGRHATSQIALPMDAMRWFIDDYEPIATFKKKRALFQAGDVVVARDEVELLGNFIEVRASSEARLPAMHAILERLCPKEPVIADSYLNLWKSRVAASPLP